MKRILSIALCAAAVAAFGEDVAVTNVAFSLYPVTSSSKETIVAISLRGMDGELVAVSDLVKTANLTEGDHLYTFEDGKYEGWTLENGAWTKASKKYTMGPAGQLVEAGVNASTVTMAVGSGIWLVRNDQYDGKSFTFYLYGKPLDKTTTIDGGKINLVGNPTTSEVTLKAEMFVSDPDGSAPANGDRIEIPGGTGVVKRVSYTYNAKQEKWMTINPETHMPVPESPTIPANQGFWYVSKGAGFTIIWSSAN